MMPLPPAPGRAIAAWLYLCCAMIFAMVVLGGLTRLTGSGLSMVDWRPIAGIQPPIGEAAWRALFAQYQASPEFQRVNFWMTIEDFRAIFWLEYLHRVWGRLIGIVFGLPLAWFVLRGRIGRALGARLAIVFVLGGAQGVLGWYMVKSGLVDRPEVSQYRLAAHLMLAIALYGYLLWTALGIGAGPAIRSRLRGHFGLAMAAIVLTMTWGALTAGLDAGHIHPTFPLMGGRLIPAELFSIAPWPADLTENAVTVQFVHRIMALTLVGIVLALWWRGRGRALGWLAVIVLIQAGLGIATLLAAVPLALAASHQTGALVLLSLAVLAAHAWERPPGAR